MKIIKKCDKKNPLPPKNSKVITKCVRYYKVWQSLLESESGIRKCDNHYLTNCDSTEVHTIIIFFPWRKPSKALYR